MAAIADIKSDLVLLKLAREIATEIHPIGTILEKLSISESEFDYIRRLPRFQQMLENCLIEWHGATNAHERVKLKAASMIEEWLPEVYERIHDRTETLASKIEAGKLIARFAGMGIEKANIEGATEKFSLTINIGDGEKHEVKVERPVLDLTPEGNA